MSEEPTDTVPAEESSDTKNPTSPTTSQSAPLANEPPTDGDVDAKRVTSPNGEDKPKREKKPVVEYVRPEAVVNKVHADAISGRLVSLSRGLCILTFYSGSLNSPLKP